MLYQAVVEKEQRSRELLDYAQAHVCWILGEINRDRKQRMRPFQLDDFLLFSRPASTAQNGHTAAPQTEEAVRAQQQVWLSMFKMEEAKAQQQGMSFFTISTNEDA